MNAAGSASNLRWHPGAQKYRVWPSCSVCQRAVFTSTVMPHTGSTASIAVSAAVEYQRVEVQLMRLVDGELPKYPIFIVDSVPLNTFHADDLLAVRRDDANQILASQHGLRTHEVEAQLASWSDVLRNYGDDFLAGDLTVLDELERMVRHRARQHRHEIGVWLPESASADEEAHAIQYVRTGIPEGVTVVARRYRQAGPRNS